MPKKISIGNYYTRGANSFHIENLITARINQQEQHFYITGKLLVKIIFKFKHLQLFSIKLCFVVIIHKAQAKTLKITVTNNQLPASVTANFMLHAFELIQKMIYIYVPNQSTNNIVYQEIF